MVVLDLIDLSRPTKYAEIISFSFYVKSYKKYQKAILQNNIFSKGFPHEKLYICGTSRILKKPNPNLNSVWVQEQFRFAIIFIDYFLKHYPYIYRRSDDETSDRSPSAAICPERRKHHRPTNQKQIDQQSG